tara:strand:+ start:871 stop:1830 length:960 start_codon:yes stop_codon:yes gene_type:complete
MVINSFGVASTLSSIKGKHFLSSEDLNQDELLALMNLATQLKNGDRRIDLGNRVLGLIFSKASTRTRVSFQVAMARLGGQTIDLNPQISQLGRGEPIKDTSRVLSRYCDVLAIRTFEHKDILQYSNWSSIPVINALTDLEHPCQAIADFFTMKEVFGDLKNLNISYIGDGNNVANSLILSGATLGANVTIVTPKGFEPSPEILEKANTLSINSGSKVFLTNNVLEGVSDAHVLYTDVWASMGQEEDYLRRKEVFKDYSIDLKLLEHARKDSIVMHCLPAHRGDEISDEIFESSHSKIFDQAENRLHIQQALLASLLGGL